MAGATRNLDFMSGIMILPQRQTALVAKQAACLDILCEGRLRLGVGTGWNKVEYEALNVSFAKRGARMEEQINILRQLWSQEAVTVTTELHTINDAGLNPMPVQRPIPIWMGGGGDRPRWGEKASIHVIRRIARLADGWLPMWDLARQNMEGVFKPEERALELLAMCHDFCREYGRDPATLGLEGRFEIPAGTEWDWENGIKAWTDAGCSHLSVNTMYNGLTGVEQHLRRLEEFSTVFSTG
jgi:probable F420-dependent oxidoreductase